MSVKEELIEIFKSRSGGPFLFLGSGFSRRYLNLEDWNGLLTRFTKGEGMKRFGFYLSQSNGSMPDAATRLAEDFNDYWWGASEYAESVARHHQDVKSQDFALRLEVSNYLRSYQTEKILSGVEYKEEVELLTKLNVDGVITTNWDNFLENIFPDYTVYTGQADLLFSNSQEIAEIYKIHGCIKDPYSLVLTGEDYKDFNDKNTYLAAKLITLFVEHPIVFIGYSIADPNIKSILKSISQCIGKENIEKLRQNLIFIDWSPTPIEASISHTYQTVEGVQIPFTLIQANDFIEIYEAIYETKRKIPARVLRHCKEQFYTFVQSSTPEKNICVIDMDDIDNHTDIEFVVGVGVAEKAASFSTTGYRSISVYHLFDDILLDNQELDPESVLLDSVPSLSILSPNVPIYKYLKSMSINDEDSFSNYISDCKGAGRHPESIIQLHENNLFHVSEKSYYNKAYKQKYSYHSLTDLLGSLKTNSIPHFLNCLPEEKLREEVDVLREYLIAHIDHTDSIVSKSASSQYRKLICKLDYIENGF
ncbi:SIR2 family protein [Veronia pacifica]|uniref:Uncharacterized protein n=1 Tax=Veronia pacifica TaxID=1080227 RepID=A0A1C3EEU3_9GAMM|nr:SIR2 family protein [Veronia pacifica]ODA31740.1 hypothetical protein A8L45_15280 [Veronia pacifica]